MFIAVLILALLLYAAVRRVNVFEAFREGAARAIPLLKTILPTLAVFSAAMALFRESGASELLASVLSPVFRFLGVDPALVPLILVRPFSGSGALAALTDVSLARAFVAALDGSSLAAVKNGECVDTTMGLTPLAGLVMGTRCGDIDAAAVLSIMEAEKKTPAEMDTLLNKKSGLLALAGSSDCRDICSKAEKGDKAAELALEMLAYRTALYIGAYNTVIGGADAIVMTGGIGENSTEVRERIVSRLGALGIKLDKAANKKRGVTTAISSKGSKIPVIVLPTNEELMIARDAVRLLG